MTSLATPAAKPVSGLEEGAAPYFVFRDDGVELASASPKAAKRLGGIFEKAPKNWQSFAVTDGRLITGQNPASSTAGAQALLKLLAEMKSQTTASSAA